MMPSPSATRRLAACAAAALLGTGAARAQDIDFSVMESGTYDVAAREIADQVKAAGGPAVTVSAFPWAVLRQNNTTDLISGTNQYDVMSGGYYLADVYSYFQPLGDLVERDGYAEGMLPNVMEPGRSEYLDGQQIGIPYGIDAMGLLYNTDLLAAAGVDPASLATWADVIKACEAIEAATDAACLSHATGSPEQIGAFFFADYAGPFVSAEGTYALDAAAATAAAEDIAALWAHLPENGTAMSFDEAHQVFRDGQAALLVTWPSFVTNQLDADDSPIKGKWSMAPMPGEGFPWLSMWQLFVPATADREAAWTWIKAYAGPENATRNLVEHNIGSVWAATYEDPDLAASHAHYWPVLTEGFASAKNPPLSGEAQDLLTNTLQEVANGRMDAAAAIEAVNEGWAAIPVPPALLEAARASGMAAQ
jgi:multiple sugar transport system substrate-binding protein